MNSPPREQVAPDIEEEALALVADLVASGAAVEDALQEALALYPEHASLLADYAILTAGLAAAPEPETERDEALSRLVDMVGAAGARREPVQSIGRLIAEARTTGLTTDFLCRRLRIGASVLTKLERGLIVAETIPKRLLQQFADVVRSAEMPITPPIALLRSQGVAFEHRSPSAPRRGRPQRFDEAIMSSILSGEMSESDRSYWLSETGE